MITINEYIIGPVFFVSRTYPIRINPFVFFLYQNIQNLSSKCSKNNLFDDEMVPSQKSDSTTLPKIPSALDILTTGTTHVSGPQKINGSSDDDDGDYYDDDDDDDDDGSPALNSARSKFLVDTIKRKLPPRPLLIQNIESPALNLCGKGIGNALAGALACSLGSMKNVMELNLEDNNLSDSGIMCIVDAVLAINSIKALNLSSNKVGSDAAEAFARYLKHRECKLEKLFLSNADLDDNEARVMVHGLALNNSLKLLDMSRNQIGISESLNVVQPDFVTGGEAIAECLETNISLETLDLSWNLIRIDSAVAIGKALKHNYGLTHLNLGHNGFAENGAAAIGM